VEEAIRVKGLAELSRALRRVDKEAPKGLRLVGNQAADLMIDQTRPTMPKRTGRAARSLRAQSTRTSARVTAGGKIAPYYPWLDYGGEGRIKGRPPAREFIKAGRYLYPTLGRNRGKIERILQSGIVAVAEGAGLDVG
jgi:hypothetical protein